MNVSIAKISTLVKQNPKIDKEYEYETNIYHSDERYFDECMQ